jgi:hypothetical protein
LNQQTIGEVSKMIDLRRVFTVTALFVIGSVICGCGGPKVLYLKNNVHAQRGPRDIKASYANWTNPGAGHMVIPVNTPIRTGRWRGGFYFVTLDTRRRVYFELNQRNALATPSEYIDLIAASSEVPLDQMSEIARKGIRTGKAYAGMSKDGVRIALGYPAAHRTPSLDSDTWTYWQNRHRRLLIHFDENGKVTRIGY